MRTHPLLPMHQAVRQATAAWRAAMAGHLECWGTPCHPDTVCCPACIRGTCLPLSLGHAWQVWAEGALSDNASLWCAFFDLLAFGTRALHQLLIPVVSTSLGALVEQARPHLPTGAPFEQIHRGGTQAAALLLELLEGFEHNLHTEILKRRHQPMLVMISNNCKNIAHALAGRHWGQIGHLYSPKGFRGPFEWFPYALDNGAFSAFRNRMPWDDREYLKLLEQVASCAQQPRWVLVPDVVGDRAGTLRMWDLWYSRVANFGFKLAFAAQDGMGFADVPSEAEVVFIGGSTLWKQQNIRPWANRFARVHVGRVNTGRWIWYCSDCGVESTDGTGFFLGNPRHLEDLKQYLLIMSGQLPWSVRPPLNKEFFQTAGLLEPVTIPEQAPLPSYFLDEEELESLYEPENLMSVDGLVNTYQTSLF